MPKSKGLPVTTTKLPLSPADWQELLGRVLGQVTGTIVHLPGPQGRDQWFDPIAFVKMEQHGPACGQVLLNAGKSTSVTAAPFDGITPGEVTLRIERAKRASLVHFAAVTLGHEFLLQLFATTYAALHENVLQDVSARVEQGMEGAIERGLGHMLDERKETAPPEPA